MAINDPIALAQRGGKTCFVGTVVVGDHRSRVQVWLAGSAPASVIEQKRVSFCSCTSSFGVHVLKIMEEP